MSPSPHTPAPEDRFGFRFDRRYVLPALAFGIGPWSAWLRVTADEMVVRFGPWSVRTPLTNIAGTEASGPFAVVKTIGPAHLSLVDRGATFATNPDRALCVSFHEPQSILLPRGLVRSRALTVTVADVERLREVLAQRVTPSA